MAEDENAEIGGGKVAAPAATAPTTGATEWTASDARGPLNAAGEPSDFGLKALLPHEHPASEPHTIASETSMVDEAPAIPTTSHEPEPGPGAGAVEPPRRSLWPVAVGIIVGAIIGAGSAAAYYATQGGDASALTALSARVDALQKRPDPQPDLASLKSNVADLGGKMAAVQKIVDTQAKARQAALQTARKDEAAKPAFDPAPLQNKIAGLQADVDGLRKQGADVKAVDAKVAALATAVAALDGVDGKVAALRSTIDGVQKQSSAAQASIGTLQSGQKALEGKVTTSPALAVVADSLVMQIARGEPYSAQVEALASIGADPAKIAVLRENADKGVPSANVLASKFQPLADPIIASEQRTPAPNAGFLDKLKTGMFSMVSVRRSDDTTGDTLASHVALIEADLTHDDVAGAYAVWMALPPAAKAKSEAWGALSKTHAQAMQAARALQTQAIAVLGAKKS